jgi:branched-chain amino acid transport system substrate-binding protein
MENVIKDSEENSHKLFKEKTMRKYKTFFVIVTCLALVAIMLPVATGCSGGGGGEKTLKIGFMTPSTGIAAEKGAPMGDGNLDAVKYINEELGGVNGYKIEADWLDSHYEQPQAVTDVEKFMDDGCIMFCAAASTEIGFVAETANRAGFPGLVAYSSPANLRPPQHIYGMAPDYGDDWTAFAKYFMENIWQGTGKPKMALELLNNPTGAGAATAARAFADQLGIDIVAQEEHSGSTTSEMDALTRIKALNPDVLYISSTPAPAAVIIKNAITLGMYPGVTIGVCHAAMTKALIDLGESQNVQGIYGVVASAAWGADVPGMAKAMEYAQKEHPKDVGNTDYLTSWTQTLIVAEILRKALDAVGYDVLAKGDAASWAAVEQYGIQALDGYDVEGLQPPVKYTTGDNRLSNLLRIFQIDNGTMSAVTDWIEAPLVKYEEYDWFGH